MEDKNNALSIEFLLKVSLYINGTLFITAFKLLFLKALLNHTLGVDELYSCIS